MHTSPASFPLGLGLDDQIMIADLAVAESHKMLFTGGNGSGKSVFLRNIVASFIRKNTPATLQFIFIDPSLLTFGMIQDCSFLQTWVLTEPVPAIKQLAAVAQDMTMRAQQLVSEGYGSPIERHHAGKQEVPFLVIVIDELAELMRAGKKGETGGSGSYPAPRS